jgi:hypothetical protein
MTNDESGKRAAEDISVSYSQASMFLWSGLIAVFLSLAYDFIRDVLSK